MPREAERFLRFTDRTWDTEVLGSSRTVAVVFWAEWSVPSRTAVETAERLARQMPDGLTLGGVNADENPATTERYGIQGLPTLLVFHRGQATERRVGLMSREDFAQFLARQA